MYIKDQNFEFLHRDLRHSYVERYELAREILKVRDVYKLYGN